MTVDPSWTAFTDVRTAVFIDGNNFYAALRIIRNNLQLDIDYKKLQNCLNQSVDLLRIYYYTSIREFPSGDNQYSSIKRLLDYLEYNGYTIVTKPARVYQDTFGAEKVKGNMDIELVTDMLSLAYSPNPLEQVVLFSGDGDFCYALEKVKGLGIRTVVVSAQAITSDDLRRTADEFVELTSLKGIWSPSKPRTEPTET